MHTLHESEMSQAHSIEAQRSEEACLLLLGEALQVLDLLLAAHEKRHTLVHGIRHDVQHALHASAAQATRLQGRKR